MQHASKTLNLIFFLLMMRMYMTTPRYKYTFSTVNLESDKIKQWFKSNKLSLNINEHFISFKFF